jgi:hypothetical protein
MEFYAPAQGGCVRGGQRHTGIDGGFFLGGRLGQYQLPGQIED